MGGMVLLGNLAPGQPPKPSLPLPLTNRERRTVYPTFGLLVERCRTGAREGSRRVRRGELVLGKRKNVKTFVH